MLVSWEEQSLVIRSDQARAVTRRYMKKNCEGILLINCFFAHPVLIRRVWKLNTRQKESTFILVLASYTNI